MPAAIGRFDDDSDRSRALALLQGGGVVVLPTDTLYGFHAALSREHAVGRISHAKGAQPGRRYLLLASDVDMARRYAASFGAVDREWMGRIWPAPVTVIVPSGAQCPAWIGPTVALRVPASAPLRAMIAALGECVVSTSVNRQGQAPLGDAAAIAEAFGEQVDLILAGSDGEPAIASTIVDLCGERAEVVRRGDYAWPDEAG